MGEELLTYAAAAKRLGVSIPTLKAAVDHGDLRSVSFGKSRRIPAKAIADLASGIEG